MAIDVSKLKTSKGAPPAVEAVRDVIGGDTRPNLDQMKPIQFRVPESTFAAFSEQAGREFGFNKGSKSQLFLKMWDEYLQRSEKHGA